jgi:hypothetical protein
VESRVATRSDGQGDGSCTSPRREQNGLAAVQPGDIVQVMYATAGMPARSEGVVLKILDEASAVVSFWDGGPLKVPLDAVEMVERPDAWAWSNDPRD